MERINVWRPDTCNCIFEYQWDDADIERVHTLHKVIQIGSEHLILGLSPQSHYAIVGDENARKNKVYGKYLSFPILTVAGGNEFKDGVDLDLSWKGTDYARILNVSVIGESLTGQQKNTIQSWADTTFGLLKVKVN